MYDCFRPGKTWYDTEGKRIQAHGGSILFVDGTFYWYGENKEGITGMATGEKCKNWHQGVRLYSSKDLYNWQDEGVILYEAQDSTHPFFPANIMDRPHILYNAKTAQFVLWAKCSRVADFGDCFFAVCVSENIRGPFQLLSCNECVPYHAGDFDLFESDGKAYIIYENPHTEMICQTLSEDYTRLTEERSTHLPEKCPPFVREAPAYFRRNGKNYVFTSGTTGYYPNATLTHTFAQPHGKWRTLGKTCVEDEKNNSFHAQFSSVFRHPYIEDLYIALGDRWLTDLPLDIPDMENIFYRLFDKNQPPLPENFSFSEISEENTGEADYVWLPVQFAEDGTPYLRWMSRWTTEHFQEK